MFQYNVRTFDFNAIKDVLVYQKNQIHPTIFSCVAFIIIYAFFIQIFRVSEENFSRKTLNCLIVSNKKYRISDEKNRQLL